MLPFFLSLQTDKSRAQILYYKNKVECDRESNITHKYMLYVEHTKIPYKLTSIATAPNSSNFNF